MKNRFQTQFTLISALLLVSIGCFAQRINPVTQIQKAPGTGYILQTDGTNQYNHRTPAQVVAALPIPDEVQEGAVNPSAAPTGTQENLYLNTATGKLWAYSGGSWALASGSTYTASNGLTMVANDTKLGGTLTGPTQIYCNNELLRIHRPISFVVDSVSVGWSLGAMSASREGKIVGSGNTVTMSVFPIGQSSSNGGFFEINATKTTMRPYPGTVVYVATDSTEAGTAVPGDPLLYRNNGSGKHNQYGKITSSAIQDGTIQLVDLGFTPGGQFEYDAGNNARVRASATGVTFTRTSLTEGKFTIPAGVQLYSGEIYQSTANNPGANYYVAFDHTGVYPYNQNTNCSDAHAPIIWGVNLANNGTAVSRANFQPYALTTGATNFTPRLTQCGSSDLEVETANYGTAIGAGDGVIMFRF